MHHVAVVHPSASIGDMNEDGNNSGYRALFHELRRLGYIEGQNLIVERYSAEGRQERYVGLARDVVHLLNFRDVGELLRRKLQ
jgi:putative ABC transport system substrate-binding protein